MSKIETIQDLRAEIIRLQGISKQQKEAVKNDILELKDSLKPAALITGLISDITGINIDKKGFLKDGIAYTISLLFQQFVLKSERKFEKNIYHVVDSVVEKVKHFVSSFTDPEAKRRERE